jgi:hypothetical protein
MQLLSGHVSLLAAYRHTPNPAKKVKQSAGPEQRLNIRRRLLNKMISNNVSTFHKMKLVMHRHSFFPQIETSFHFQDTCPYRLLIGTSPTLLRKLSKGLAPSNNF